MKKEYIIILIFFISLNLFSKEHSLKRNLSFGLDYSTGNTDSIGGNVDFNLNYEKDIHSLIIDIDCIYAEDKKENTVTADNQKIENNYRYTFSSIYHLSLYALCQRDIPSKVKSNLQAGPGIGAKLLKTEKSSLTYDLIAAFSKKKLTNDVEKEYVAIKNIIFYSFAANEGTNFSCNLQYNLNGENEKDYNIFINPEITMHIIGNFSFSSEVIYDYNNIPPLDTKKYSTYIKSKLVYSF